MQQHFCKTLAILKPNEPYKTDIPALFQKSVSRCVSILAIVNHPHSLMGSNHLRIPLFKIKSLLFNLPSKDRQERSQKQISKTLLKMATMSLQENLNFKFINHLTVKINVESTFRMAQKMSNVTNGSK